jgi:ribosomal protein S6--L-glutamate ligase
MGKTYSPALQDQLDLLAHMESAGLPMFSSPKRLKTMISRLGCTLQLQSHDIPMPATFIGEDAGAAAEWVERKGPCVYKPLYSTKARGMEILKPGDALLESLKRIKVDSEQPLYLQQVLDLKGRDYGLVFLKGAFVGAYARVGDGSSWNTTTVNGGRYQAYDPPTEIIDLAQRAQAAFGLSFTSVDVAIGPDGPIVFEVSAFGGYRGLFEACGIDASELLVDHVLQSLGS